MTRSQTVAALSALLVVLLPGAALGQPRAGTWTNAHAEWLTPAKRQGHFKVVAVDVTEFRTVDGEVITNAFVGRGRCRMSGDIQLCGMQGEKIRKTTLKYDATLSEASARIVTTDGELVTVDWSETEPVPAGIDSISEQCGSSSGAAAAVSKNATAEGRLFGQHLATESSRDYATMSTGVRETDCS